MRPAAEIVVVGAGPHPGADAAAVAREIAARLPDGPPGRVLVVAHSPEPVEAPFPIPLQQVGPILRDWGSRGLTWAQTRPELIAVRDRFVDTDGAGALRRAGVAVVSGRVGFVRRDCLALETFGPDGEVRLLDPDRVVLATGAVPRIPDLPGLPDVDVLTAASVLELPELPESLIVLGAGSLGCELAQGLARLGSTVTLVDGRPRVLPDDDADAALAVDAALRAGGVRLLLGATAAKVAPTLDGGVWLGTDTVGDVAAEALVVAVGRQANVAGLDLATGGIRTTTDGAIEVDDRLRTANPDVLACGEVTGQPVYGAAPGPMARVAAAGVVARRTAVRWAAPVPTRVTRTEPEVVQIGDVADREHPVAEGTTVGACRGPAPGSFVSVVIGPPTSRGVLGLGGPSARSVCAATLVGRGAADASGQLMLAVNAGLPAAALIDTVAADGTWAAAIQVAVAQALVNS